MWNGGLDEFLTAEEVLRMVATACSTGRYRQRDAMLILMMHRHKMAVREIANLRWSQISLQEKTLQLSRTKRRRQLTHALSFDEVDWLGEIRIAQLDAEFIFCSERKRPLTNRSLHAIVARAGHVAGIEFPVHPHVLCHAKALES
jgi:type 1 fimbriae regulatory protein FimB/type 1 fimbriae regulatory protein FimE